MTSWSCLEINKKLKCQPWLLFSLLTSFFVQFARTNHKNFPSQKAFQKKKGCLNTGIMSACKRDAAGWWPRTLCLAPSPPVRCKLQSWGCNPLVLFQKRRKKRVAYQNFSFFFRNHQSISPAVLRD